MAQSAIDVGLKEKNIKKIEVSMVSKEIDIYKFASDIKQSLGASQISIMSVMTNLHVVPQDCCTEVIVHVNCTAPLEP